jgi:hypothetical protein
MFSVLGNTALAGSVAVNASVASALVPASTNTLAIGSSGSRWAQAYFGTISANSAAVAGALTAAAVTTVSGTTTTTSLGVPASSLDVPVSLLVQPALTARLSATPSSNVVSLGTALAVNGVGNCCFLGAATVALPSAASVRLNGVALSTTLGSLTASNAITNATLTGTTTATDATITTSACTLAAPTAASDLIAQYASNNTNSINATYNNLSSASSLAFSSGNVVFRNATDALSTSLVTNAALASIAGVTGYNTTLAFTLRLQTLPTASNTSFVLLQIGAQTASQNSLAVTLYNNALVLMLSSVDSRTYLVLTTNTDYDILINKSTSTVLELYVNGAAISASSSSGAPAYGAYGTNAFVVGATSVGAAVVGASISGLCVAFTTTLHTPTSFAALQKAYAQSATTTLYPPVTLNEKSSCEGPVSFASTTKFTGDMQLAALRSPDVIADYSASDFNGVNPALNKLAGTQKLVDGVFAVVQTTDTMSTTLVDRTGTSVANATAISFTFGMVFAYLPTTSSVVFQVGTQGATHNSLCLTLETSLQLALRTSANNYFVYAALTPNTTYTITVAKSSSAGIQLWVNGALQTPVSTSGAGAPVYAAFGTSVLVLGATLVGPALPGLSLSNMVVALSTGGVQNSASVLSDAKTKLNATTLSTATAYDSTTISNLLATNAIGGHSDVVYASFTSTTFATTASTSSVSLTTRAGSSVLAGCIGVRFNFVMNTTPAATSCLVLFGTQGATQNSLALTLNAAGTLVLALSTSVYITYTSVVTFGVVYDVMVSRQTSSPYLVLWLNGALQSGTTTGVPAYVQLGANTLTVGSSAGVGTAPAGCTLSNLRVTVSAGAYTPTTFGALQQPLAQSALGIQNTTLGTPLTVTNAFTASKLVCGSGPASTTTIFGNLQRTPPMALYTTNVTTPATAYTEYTLPFTAIDPNMSYEATGVVCSSGVFTNTTSYPLVVRVSWSIGEVAITSSHFETWLRYTGTGYTNADFCRAQIQGWGSNWEYICAVMNLLMSPGSTFRLMGMVGDASQTQSMNVTLAVY